MTPRQPARSLSRATVASSRDAVRLELLESYLIHQDDVARCAQSSLEWLARHAGVRRSICLIVDRDPGTLMGVAGYGVPAEDVDLFAWPLADPRDPLVAALSASGNVAIRPARANGEVGRTSAGAPLGAGPFTAIPLRGARERQEGALGLLLLRQAAPVSPDITWLATVLGQKLDQILGRGSLSEEVRKLRRERSLLFTIINSVTDPIIVTDQTGETVLMNAPAEELFTVPSQQEESAERSVQANDAHFSSFISGMLLGETGPGEIRRGEIGLVNPTTSELIPVEAIAGKVLTESGELTAVVTILHDRREALERARLYEQLKLASDGLQARVHAAATELATQNELLRRQAIELEQASRLKSQFLANMSHEFRTPLNAILGYTHMLLNGVAGDRTAAAKRQLQRIDSNGRHLLTIINEILDITRIEAGKMPIQLSAFNVNDVVPEVMAELDPVISRSKLSVAPRLAPDGPLVHSDRQKVKQIVVNLLSNALKFTHQGGIEIAVQYDAPPGTVSISVSDTGIGIAPEHHERIFEDFRQVDDSPSRQYGGTGLGLAICGRLATALRGRITLGSNLGQGSTFTLTIPVDAPQ